MISMVARLLRPSCQAGRINELSQVELLDRGIEGLIVDLDNTITEWGRETMDEEVVDWLKQAQVLGLKICLVSNNRGKRLARIAEELGVPYIEGATKPRRKAFRQAAELIGVGLEKTAVIGDQIFTDVLGGNRMGLYTILVSPMSKREFVGTRLIRIPERAVLKWLRRTRSREVRER